MSSRVAKIDESDEEEIELEGGDEHRADRRMRPSERI